MSGRPRGAVDHGHWAGLEYHHQLLEDPFRTDAYERAIRALVRPGMRVLDLGCGTGVLSLLAARRGAIVHAVESTPIIRVAEALARANGLERQIHFHHADAEAFEPVEPVDLVISDFMGRFVVDDGMLAAARNAGRWLAPGGRFAPSKIRMFLAPATCKLRPWEVFSTGFSGLDLTAALPLLANSGWAAALTPEGLLGESSLYATLDPPHRIGPFDGHLRFVLRRGRLQALAGWFEADLAPGITLHTGPGHETHWGQYLFPVPVVDVDDGDTLDVHVRFDEPTSEWRWSGTLASRGAKHAFAYTSEPEIETRPLPSEAPQARDRDAALAHHEAAIAIYGAGHRRDAADLWEAAVRALRPEDDDLAPLLYEHLGRARLALGEDGAAARAFLRALDGTHDGREAAAKHLPVAFERAGYPIAAAKRFPRG